MDARRAVTATLIAFILVIAYSAGALASPPAATAAAPVAAPASESALITATGSAFVNTPSTTDFAVSPQSLNITAQSRAAPADVEAAIAEMQQRLLNIKTALEKLGVPSSGIRFQGLSLQPIFGTLQPGQPSPVEKGQPIPQQITSFGITGSMQADVPDVRILVGAMNAVTANGATGVNAYPGKGGGAAQGNPQPPSDVLQKGLADAIANAQTTAAASAAASGKKLGDIHSVAVNQIYPQCCPPGQGGWNISVTVSWNIAP